MKYAADFRKDALKALKGKWGVCVIAALIATLLLAIEGSGLNVELDYRDSNLKVDLEFSGNSLTVMDVNAFSDQFMVVFVCAVIFAVFLFVLQLFIGSNVRVGYCRFNLELMEGKKPETGILFSYFGYWKTMVKARFLKEVYIFLWMLLLIVPGILASFSYSMTEYILAENPEMSAGDALRKSKEMMKGNRWRLFCMHLSFIGWNILTALTLGIGNLWLTPYTQAAETAFYRDLTGRECVQAASEEAQAE